MQRVARGWVVGTDKRKAKLWLSARLARSVAVTGGVGRALREKVVTVLTVAPCTKGLAFT